MACLRTFFTLLFTLFYKFKKSEGKGTFHQRFLLEKKAWDRNEKRDLTKEVLGFEVASEGELEQVSPLMRFFREKGYHLEIYYASLSVKKKAEELGQKINRAVVRPLPLFTYSLFPSCFGANINYFSKAQTLILCRYDFYPELLLWKMFKKKGQLILISGTLKNKKNKGIMRRWLYSHFDHIVCASSADYQRFCDLGLDPNRLSVFDFRINQILSRQAKALSTFKEKGAGLFSYTEDLKGLKSHQKIILGSVYAQELDIICHGPLYQKILNNELHICLACHSLKKENRERVKDILIKKFSDKRVFILNSDNILTLPSLLGSIVLCQIPGVLCELYTSFSYCYVGGGFQRSIHSVLEPYLAQNAIVCGPKTHRSTEFEMAQKNTPQLLISVSHLSQVAPAFIEAQKDEILNLENQKKVEEWALSFDQKKLAERGEDIVRKRF